MRKCQLFWNVMNPSVFVIFRHGRPCRKLKFHLWRLSLYFITSMSDVEFLKLYSGAIAMSCLLYACGIMMLTLYQFEPLHELRVAGCVWYVLKCTLWWRSHIVPIHDHSQRNSIEKEHWEHDMHVIFICKRLVDWLVSYISWYKHWMSVSVCMQNLQHM